MSDEIKVVKMRRNEHTHLPEELIRRDEVLMLGIRQYCRHYGLKPIYVHDSVAIFSDHYLIAAWPEEID